MEQSRAPSRQLIRLGVVVWVSFLSAAIATMLFFATFDPESLSQLATFPMTLDRTSGYSIGFLLFWILLMLNGWIVTWLLQSGKPSNDIEPQTKGEHHE
ncbi:hypothetical protein GCM10008090_28930 [Arenicella chitinivorans]|uniref:Uncharacterized protein n=1 Tax=Arenicella chitinivorans TaxID=1329800 RepID=A0A918RZI2_9GAMM|nr:hypothetical protein [Arenicella chitinivorans]GHA17449.1 hypothetical protein GCM10008090_28930 [Arenicella chitinivorans]